VRQNKAMDRVHPHDLKGRKVLLMGLGSFGGGAGCARALIQYGADLTITDLRPESSLQSSLDSLQGLNWTGHFEGHSKALFDWADYVVVNPAVPDDAAYLQYARARGCSLTTEINLALELAPKVPTVAITGTHGKSTTAALVADLLEPLEGNTVLAGNMGGSLLEVMDGLGSRDQLVLELSSFQLERLLAPPNWPKAALLTCLREDHLDRHLTLQAYAEAKLNLLKSQGPTDCLYLPANEPCLQTWRNEARGVVKTLDPSTLDPTIFGLHRSELPMSEPYRASALLAAVAVAQDWNVSPIEMGPILRDFKGLPHRLQKLPSPDWLNLVDNGIATHPEPTAEALRNLSGPVFLIAGGKDKGLSLSQLVEAASTCQSLHLFGTGGHRLANELAARTRQRVKLHPSCQAAAEAALAELPAPATDCTLLFSPSFSSYDEFNNFQQRASLFQKICVTNFATTKREPVTPAVRRATLEPEP
jgi:UDP-N-acetylmuramoylalanine--D-glutamate ligase